MFLGQLAFSAKTYTYFVNDDIKAGKDLVSLEVKIGNKSLVTYEIMPRTRRRVLKIDSSTATITLLKDLKKFLQLRSDGTRRLFFKVARCQKGKGKRLRRRRCAFVNVRIIALRRDFGDQFVEEALKHVTPENLTNHILKGETTKRITPSVLLRILRKIPKASEEIAMMDGKQEMLLDYVKRKIVRVLSLRKLTI